MQVCIISQYFPPDTGGASTRAANVANSLIQLGHDVTVVTAFPHYPRGIIPAKYRRRTLTIESKDGIQVVRVWVPSLPHEGIMKRFLMYVMFSISSLMSLPLCRHADITWAMSPNYLCVLPATARRITTGAKVVHDVVDIWPGALAATGYSFPRSLMRAVGLVSRLSYVLSDFITTIAESMKSSLKREVPSSVRVEVVENCVTPDFFKVEPREEKSSFRIMYLGTLGPANDFSVIIEAARKLQHDEHIKFTIAGSGELAGVLQDSITRNKMGNVDFYEQSISHSEVPAWLTGADVLVLPLRSGFGNTSFPSKLGEYLATGRPVICMADGQLARVVKEGKLALLVEPSDVSGLVEAILQLRVDKTLYTQLSSAGREYARTYLSLNAFQKKVDKVVQDAMAGASNPTGLYLEDD